MSMENPSHFKELLASLEALDATEEDLEGILRVQSQKIIRPEDQDDMRKMELAESGFLIYSTSFEELKAVLENREACILKVVKNENGVAGYMLSYDMEEWKKTHPDWFSLLESTEEGKNLLQKSRVLYGRHIAVDESALGSDAGKVLVDSTLHEARDRGYEYFVVEALKSPITNKRSTYFVEKMGFVPAGSIADCNGRVWAVFLKSLLEK